MWNSAKKTKGMRAHGEGLVQRPGGVVCGLGPHEGARSAATIGAPRMMRKIACGALAATLIFATVPTGAIAKSGVTGISDDALVSLDGADQALSGYNADFSNEDIALPEGVEASNEGISVTDGAARSLCMADDYTNWKRRSDDVDYTIKGLGYVNKSAKRVGSYGRSFFDVLMGTSTGYYGQAFNGAMSFLKLTGVLPADDEGVSNEELKKDISQLKTLVDGMSDRLDENTKQTYQNRLTVFDNAVGALGIECSTMEKQFAKGYELAEKRGLLDQSKQSEPQAPAELKLPAEPAAVQLPAEPAAVELPAKPEAPASAASENQSQPDAADKPEVAVLGDSAQPSPEANGAYDQAVADWQAECERLNAEHDKAVEAWKAECDKLNAEHDKAVADWKAECERLKAEHDKAQADYEKAHEEWANRPKDVDTILVQLMRDEDAKGNRDFRDFSQHMNDIRHNFEIVSVECAKKGGSSPFHAFDSYWNLYFNWETQGYYLRLAYRTQAEFALKRAYSLLGLYNGFAANPDDKDATEPLTEALKNALKGIEAQPAGTDPSTINPDGKYAVKCFANNRIATRGYAHFYATGCGFTDQQVNTYKKRLHGNSIKEDLKLAGLYSPIMDVSNPLCPDGKNWWAVAGIGCSADTENAVNAFCRFFGATNYHYFNTKILKWNGSFETVKTADDEGKCKGTEPKYHCLDHLTYWWFDFK